MKPILPATFRPHFPTLATRDTAKQLAAFGLKEAEIAVILRCTLEEVKLHYEQELKSGLVMVNAQMQAVVVHKAIHERDLNAAKFWLINKAGWRMGDSGRALIQVNQNNGNSGADANAPPVAVVERRAVMATILEKVTAAKRRDEKVIEVRPDRKGPAAPGNSRH